MVTLLHTAHLLAKAVGIESPTTEEINMFKTLTAGTYATLLKRDITRHSENSVPKTRHILELEESPIITCKEYCDKVVQTKHKIPLPIKFEGRQGFELVSSPDIVNGLTYNYLAPENLRFYVYQGRFSTKPYYTFVDSKIVILYQYTPDFIAVTDIFPNPADIIDLCLTASCSAEYPIQEDLLTEILTYSKSVYLGKSVDQPAG